LSIPPHGNGCDRVLDAFPKPFDTGGFRGRIYEWARERPDLVRKNGRASLVDFDIFDEILDALPTAGLKTASDDKA
jgi:hypothetical protein